MQKMKYPDNWPERHLYTVISSHDIESFETLGMSGPEYQHRSFRMISNIVWISGKVGLKTISWGLLGPQRTLTADFVIG